MVPTHVRALGRLPVGKRNRTEEAYEALLQQRLLTGEILWYSFEGVKLRLANNTFYTVDFPVLAKDGIMEMHEVKGFWTDDARVKIKVAASMFPFRFIAVRQMPKRQGGGWNVEEF